jgi:hypothetical protein
MRSFLHWNSTRILYIPLRYSLTAWMLVANWYVARFQSGRHGFDSHTGYTFVFFFLFKLLFYSFQSEYNRMLTNSLRSYARNRPSKHTRNKGQVARFSKNIHFSVLFIMYPKSQLPDHLRVQYLIVLSETVITFTILKNFEQTLRKTDISKVQTLVSSKRPT